MTFKKLPYTVQAASFAVLVFSITYIGLKFSFVDTRLAQVWSPTGLSLVIVLFFGIRFLPAIFFATAANYILVTGSIPLGIVFAIGSSMEAAIGYSLLVQAGFDTTLKRLKDIWYLFSLVGVVSTLAGAIISVTAMGIINPQMWNGYLFYLGLWWFGNCVGTLIVTPLLLQLINAARQHWNRTRIAEYAVLLTALFVISYVIFHGRYFKEYLNYSFVYLVFPFTIWCSIRFGMTGAATSVYLVSLNAIISTQTQTGLFAAESYATSIVLLDGFLVLLSMTSLGLAALVAERDTAERSLRRSEENYRIVAEQTGQLVYDYNIETGQIFWSGAIKEVTQYTPQEFTRFDILQWENNIHPNDRLRATAMLDEAMKKNAEYNVEYKFQRKDGSHIDVLDRGTFLYTAEGKAYRMLGTMADISEQKRIEVELRAGEERFRTITNALTVPLIITRISDGKILYANRFVAESAGVKLEDLIGSSTSNFYRRMENRGKLINALVERGRVSDFELDVVTFSGRKGTVIVSAELGTFQGEKAVVATYYDVTQRKQLEQTLAENEERFRLLVEKSADGICLFDRRGKLLYATPSVERMVGYTVDEIKTMNILSLTDPSERKIHRDNMYTLFHKGESVHFTQVRCKHKNGSWVYLEGSFTNLVDNPRIMAIVCNFRNVTDRIQTEERIHRSLQEKEILLKEVHHRVKNNMQVISSLLSLHSSSIKNSRARSIFLESQNRVKSMALVHEVLYQTKDIASVDMVQYIKRLMGVVQQSYAAKTKFVAIAPKIANINLDIDAAIPCGLIVNELVTNALKHAFADRKKGRITVALSRSNTTHVVLTISDDGRGLPKGFSLVRQHSLGLTLVHALTEQLKGTLTVRVRRGTAFSVRFPIVSEPSTVS